MVQDKSQTNVRAWIIESLQYVTRSSWRDKVQSRSVHLDKFATKWRKKEDWKGEGHI